MPGGKCHCVLCGQRIRNFLPFRKGIRPCLMETLEVVGSDIKNFECPRCGGHDRERHLLLYFRASGLLERIRGKNILHVAPERELSRHIRSAAPATYLRCDLHPTAEDILRVDILKMEFESGSFNFVIANHVLEHVADDITALKEIHRVLKDGGCAILQTPYSQKLQHTWQDPGIDNGYARLQAYGQEDHVRLYGRDIFQRMESVGFQTDIKLHSDILRDIDPGVAGVNAKEPLFLLHKRH